MSTEYEKLKSLLFKDEMADLAAFRKLLNDDEALAKKLSEVLSQASDLTIQQNAEFQDKFVSNHPDVYLNVLKRDPKGLMALLTPIISPAIRSAVLQSMRRFISEINQKLEQGFSLKSLKWRWKAYRTGVPFSEIIFENTIQYQVQQLFLIDKESGLLVEYVGQEDQLMQDKEAMSAMLTAIQDFVSDSLKTETGTLSAAELGDDLLWVFPGANYNLAALIKGAPSSRLRTQLADLLSYLHIKYRQDYQDQSLWNNHLAAQHDMAEHLIQKDLHEDKKTVIWPWLLILISGVLWFSYQSYSTNKKHAAMREQLTNTAGLVINQLDMDADRFIMTGLKDPLTDTRQFKNVTFNTQSFYSLDDKLVQKRVQQHINDNNIISTFKAGVLTVTGSTDQTHDWKQLKLLPGITEVINNTQDNNITAQLTRFINKHPVPFDLDITANNQQITVSGMVQNSLWPEYNDLLSNTFTTVDTANVILIPPRNTLIKYINESPLLIQSPISLSETNKSHLQQIIKWDGQLKYMYDDGLMILHSQSDCQGSLEKSMKNNQSRLAMVKKYLIQFGIKADQIESVIEVCEAESEQTDPNKIGIWFEKK